MTIEVHKGRPGVDDSALSNEDRKKVDDRLRPVVEGLAWSMASTGLWLTVYVNGIRGETPAPLSPPLAIRSNEYHPGYTLALVASHGRPKMSCAGFGSAIELPSDLARDALKRQYLIEWLKDTTKECLLGVGQGVQEDKAEAFVMWLALSADDAIHATGL